MSGIFVPKIIKNVIIGCQVTVKLQLKMSGTFFLRHSVYAVNCKTGWLAVLERIGLRKLRCIAMA